LELNSDLFSRDLLLLTALLYGAVLVTSLRLARWRWIFAGRRIHLYLGTILILLVLWHLRAQAEATVAFHVLGVTTLTLMFGWSLAIIASALILLGLTLNGRAEWEMFALNGLLSGVLPITLSQISLLLVRTYLPKNFFIFVLGNGFLTAGLAAVFSIWIGLLLLVVGGVYSYAKISEVYFPFLPMLFFPEAFLNGWAVTALTCYRPEWIYAFSDELYLHGK